MSLRELCCLSGEIKSDWGVNLIRRLHWCHVGVSNLVCRLHWCLIGVSNLVRRLHWCLIGVSKIGIKNHIDIGVLLEGISLNTGLVLPLYFILISGGLVVKDHHFKAGLW